MLAWCALCVFLIRRGMPPGSCALVACSIQCPWEWCASPCQLLEHPRVLRHVVGGATMRLALALAVVQLLLCSWLCAHSFAAGDLLLAGMVADACHGTQALQRCAWTVACNMHLCVSIAPDKAVRLQYGCVGALGCPSVLCSLWM
jgi:hypothetical protein